MLLPGKYRGLVLRIYFGNVDARRSRHYFYDNYTTVDDCVPLNTHFPSAGARARTSHIHRTSASSLTTRICISPIITPGPDVAFGVPAPRGRLISRIRNSMLGPQGYVRDIQLEKRGEALASPA